MPYHVQITKFASFYHTRPNLRDNVNAICQHGVIMYNYNFIVPSIDKLPKNFSRSNYRANLYRLRFYHQLGKFNFDP